MESFLLNSALVWISLSLRCFGLTSMEFTSLFPFVFLKTNYCNNIIFI